MKRFQLNTTLVGCELPGDLDVRVVALFFPGRDVAAERFVLGDAAGQALAPERAGVTILNHRGPWQIRPLQERRA